MLGDEPDLGRNIVATAHSERKPVIEGSVRKAGTRVRITASGECTNTAHAGFTSRQQRPCYFY